MRMSSPVSAPLLRTLSSRITRKNRSHWSNGADGANRSDWPDWGTRGSRSARTTGKHRFDGADRSHRSNWSRRGDVKRKVAINPQTMGNYKKIKSITLRMEPSGTTWAAFLRG